MCMYYRCTAYAVCKALYSESGVVCTNNLNYINTKVFFNGDIETIQAATTNSETALQRQPKLLIVAACVLSP